MNPPESFWYEGAGGTRVQGMLIRPPHFDASKKYPLLLLIHGGPQSLWTDSWGYRWNEELFAAPGYVAVMINPRGSTSYGQKFTDEVTDDWGGRAYEDLMKGVDYVIAKISLRRPKPLGRGRGLVWRLHDRLDRDAHRALQGAHQPRRRVR